MSVVQEPQLTQQHERWELLGINLLEIGYPSLGTSCAL